MSGDQILLSEEQQQPAMDKQSELMLKYGPKDTCWVANWGEKDEPLLQKYFIKSATLGRENNPMVIEFFDQLDKKWNEHRGILEIDGQKFEIIDIAKTSDIVTIQGLQYCCRQIMTAGLLTWRYFAVGTSSIEARAYQQALFGGGFTRIDMTQPGQGSVTRVNQSMRFVATFPSTFPTLTVRESGIYNEPSGSTGTLLNRQVFASNPIGHTVNVSPFTAATDINFSSVTTYG